MSVSRNAETDSSFSTDDDNFRNYGYSDPYANGRKQKTYSRRNSAASSHSKRSRKSNRPRRKIQPVSSEDDTSDSDGGASLPQAFGYDSDDGVSLQSGVRSLRTRRRNSAFGKESIISNGLGNSLTHFQDAINFSSDDENNVNSQYLIASPRSKKKRAAKDSAEPSQLAHPPSETLRLLKHQQCHLSEKHQ